jgi:hypothetical protein
MAVLKPHAPGGFTHGVEESCHCAVLDLMYRTMFLKSAEASFVFATRSNAGRNVASLCNCWFDLSCGEGSPRALESGPGPASAPAVTGSPGR